MDTFQRAGDQTVESRPRHGTADFDSQFAIRNSQEFPKLEWSNSKKDSSQTRNGPTACTLTTLFPSVQSVTKTATEGPHIHEVNIRDRQRRPFVKCAQSLIRSEDHAAAVQIVANDLLQQLG